MTTPWKEFKFIPSLHDNTLLQVYFSCSIEVKNEQMPAIIIAHPYGPLGGSLHNNVISALQQYYVNKGYLAVCINFRGSGQSKGKTSWTGMPERDDYITVMNYLLENFNLTQLVLCGYSYGAMIANSISTDKLPVKYLLISMPLGVFWALATTKASFFKQHQLKNQVLLLYGTNDQFTRPSTFVSWAKNYDNITLVALENVDHFWVDREQLLIDQLSIYKELLE